MPAQTVLVIRATGSQGRAVCSSSVRQGLNVRALVRDAGEDRAIALQKIGVTLFEGSIDDRNVLHRAVTGDCIFLALMPRMAEQASELRQARLVIDAAQAAHVKHIIYSSVIVSRDIEGVISNSTYRASLTAKQGVEDLIQESGLDNWTIIRPGYFMTNFFTPLSSFMFPELAHDQKFVSSLQPDTILPLIDPGDVGAFATAAFSDPARFNAKVLTLASEKRTVTEVVQLLSQASGRDIRPVYRDEDEKQELAKTNPIAAGQLMIYNLAKEVDMDEVKSWGVPLTTFEEFLQREHELVRKTFDEPRQSVPWQALLSKPS